MIHEEPPPSSTSFLDQVLQPGSSLQPNFLLAVDVAFTLLFLVLVTLLYLTAGNLHVVALILVELALWASVKWCVVS
ncbi:hypothetical protein JOM56_013856 [Amanita muscaria]